VRLVFAGDHQRVPLRNRVLVLDAQVYPEHGPFEPAVG
jgi:hypothetical protein